MIRGVFLGDGRPRVRANIELPNLGYSEWVNLLVDTGAVVSCLHPRDLEGTVLDSAQLTRRVTASGVGGSQDFFLQDARLTFDDDGTLRTYQLEILIADAATAAPFSSLLGQDILRHWRMVHDPIRGVVRFTVRQADATFPVQRTAEGC